MGENEKDNPGHITPELCEAYRETVFVKIDGMEKSIKMSIAIVGVFISVVVLLSQYYL